MEDDDAKRNLVPKRDEKVMVQHGGKISNQWIRSIGEQVNNYDNSVTELEKPEVMKNRRENVVTIECGKK